MARPTILVAAATRPCQGETANGDAWQVDWHENACRVAVIDALGHGPVAAREAESARRALAANPSSSPEDALRACHSALAGGRGAAISVVHIDPVEGELVFAGIGNVEGVLWTGGGERRFSPDRGIVGSIARNLHPLSLPLDAGWLLMIFTDGVRARFRLGDLLQSPVASADPQELASAVIERWSRPQDDATVVVACAGASPQSCAG